MSIRVSGQHLPAALLLLVGLEAVLFFLDLVGAGVVRFNLDVNAAERYQGVLWPRAMLFSAMMVTGLLAFGLYSARQRARGAGLFVRFAAAIGAGVAGTAVFFFLVPDLWIGRGVLGLATLGAAVAISIVRLAFRHVADGAAFKRRVLVYGAGQRAATITRLRRRSDQRYFTLVGYVQCEGETVAVPQERLLCAKKEDGLPALCQRLGVEEVIVAMDDRRRAFPVRELLECRLLGIEVTELLSFLERETGRVRIDMLDPSWLIFSEGFKFGSVRHATASFVDIVASVLIFLLTLPTMLIVALAIKLEDGWQAPVLYRQERVGLRGRTFQLLKFRSMRVDAEGRSGAQWAQRNDPRVTRIGAIIRILRIDELPQIINVLRGDMNFVGPRPERPQFVAELARRIPYYGERHCVKPGITGWAQLCFPYGSSEQDALEKLQYDLYYIKNNCLLFDLSILVQTVEVVLLGNGAR
jgi:sugar transferase (PEP-CTERM system associated)